MKQEHPSMPISKDRQSRVEYGRVKKILMGKIDVSISHCLKETYYG